MLCRTYTSAINTCCQHVRYQYRPVLAFVLFMGNSRHMMSFAFNACHSWTASISMFSCTPFWGLLPLNENGFDWMIFEICILYSLIQIQISKWCNNAVNIIWTVYYMTLCVSLDMQIFYISGEDCPLVVSYFVFQIMTFSMLVQACRLRMSLIIMAWL